MANVSYNLKLQNAYITGTVDNTPLFNRVVKEIDPLILQDIANRTPSAFSDGILNERLIVDRGFLKTRTLNGPALLFDQTGKTNTYYLESNNSIAYIYKRFNNNISVYKQYDTIYKDSKFQIPGFTSIEANETISDFEILGVDATHDTIVFKTKYFPLNLTTTKLIISGVDTLTTPTGVDRYNGLFFFVVLKTATPNITGVKIEATAVPSIHPTIDTKFIDIENSTESVQLQASNKTSSVFDNVAISPRTISLSKADESNPDFDTVTIRNYSYEYLFIEPEQNVQINNKTIPGGSESILPGKYNELNIKLARSTYGAVYTSFKVNIGIYDRYNHVKKYIDTITINITG